MRLVTHGAPVITLSNPGNTFTGSTTVANGVLRAGAANVLATSAAVVVRGGAALDLDGFAQTVKNLSGDGWVLLGSSTLTVAVADGGTSAFNGTFSGATASRVVKTGAGKLVLGTPSAYPFDNSIAWPWFVGVTELREGTLSLATSAALGAGTLNITGADTVLSAGAPGLVLPNNINLGANELTFEIAHPAVFSGVLSGNGGSLVARGAVTLTGANTFTGGARVAPGARLVAGHARALGTGAVGIEEGGVLEFSLAASGAVNNTLAGHTVEFSNFARHAVLSLGGENRIDNFIVRPGGVVLATSTGALGGAAAVTIQNGGELAISRLGTAAASLDVQRGGRLIFSPAWAENTDPMLVVDTAHLADGAVIGMGRLATGEYLLLKAGTLTSDGRVTYDAGPYGALGVDITHFNVDLAAGEVTFRAMNHVANPGKDIAAHYDALTATNNAIYSRVSESFLLPPDRQAGPEYSGLWAKAVGSYADNEGDSGKIGYTSDTHGLLAGFDKKISEKLLLGFYAGMLDTSVRAADRISRNDGTQTLAGIYGALRLGRAYASADIMFGAAKADTSRFEQTGYATGSYRADTFGASIELGAVLAAWEKGSIKPSLSLHRMGMSYRGQRETGDGAVLIDDLRADTWESLLSVQVTQEITLPWKKAGVIDGVLGWRSGLKDSSMHIRGRFARDDRPFALELDQYNRDGLLIGLGLRVGLTRKATFAFGYDYELGGEFDRHTLHATLRLNW
ncbi:MAG: autotransporter domain-containing protein [Opitutaceae bacterium]|nr:autotransporter domain-containing protein [Opitutaceae bacterium]